MDENYLILSVFCLGICKNLKLCKVVIEVCFWREKAQFVLIETKTKTGTNLRL